MPKSVIVLIAMMDMDSVIAVNDQDEIVGYPEKMEAHIKGILHRAVSVFILNSKGEWLLQQRQENKYHSALLWSNACCTHPFKGESNIDAAKRRLYEEMNLKSSLRSLFTFQYKTLLNNGLIENELDHVFVGITDEIPRINPEEVASYRYVLPEELAQEIETNSEQFTAWFKLLFDRIKNELGQQEQYPINVL